MILLKALMTFSHGWLSFPPPATGPHQALASFFSISDSLNH